MSPFASDKFVSFIASILIVLFLFAVTMCFIIPKGNEVLWVNGNYSAFQDVFFSSVTWIGKTMVFVIVIAVLAFIRFNYAILLSAVLLLNSVLVLFLKRVVFPDMERPTAWLDNSLLHFVEGVDIQTLYSFPSGHTAIVFSLAITLSLCLKNRGWFTFLLALALLVGYSRIYLLQHHLMDVVAGAFIGAASSFIVYYLKPITWVQWVHKIIQNYFMTKDGQFVFLPPFLVKSRRVKQWAERVLSESY